MGNNTEFQIKYDGELHQIDANVLINSLLAFTTTIQEINKSLEPERKIQIKVNALEKGSFIVDLVIVEQLGDVISSLMTLSNPAVTYTSGIVTVFLGLLQLKKHLKGKKPKSIEHQNGNTIIENNTGQIIVAENVTYHIYDSSPIARHSLAKGFESLSLEPSISKIEIKVKDGKNSFEANQKDFPEMATETKEESERCRTFSEEAELHIFKVVFEKRFKWEFYYKGNRITATILDESFFKRIDDGESFAKGDTLKAELHIHQAFDESVNTYVNKSYEIIRVIGHTPKEQHPKFDF